MSIERLRSSLHCSVSHRVAPSSARAGARPPALPKLSISLAGESREQRSQSHSPPFQSRQYKRIGHIPVPAWSLHSLPEAQLEAVPQEFSDKYLLRRLLGKGSFGTVRSAIDKKTGLEWAAKIMPKKVDGKDPQRLLQRIREEVEILKALQHRPETLQLHEVIEDDNCLCIVTELCYGCDLEHLLRERSCLSELEVAPIIHGALSVLEECHRNGICYGDVKPANFLLKWPYPSAADPSSLPQIRVADFGCAQFIRPGVEKKQGGTPLYVAPEQFMQTVGLESDMWGLGMLFYHLLCGRLPFADSFKNSSPMDVMMAILSEDISFEGPRWDIISKDAQDLITRMLDRDYNTRVKPGDALLDPWMTKHYWGPSSRIDFETWDHPPKNCEAGF